MDVEQRSTASISSESQVGQETTEEVTPLDCTYSLTSLLSSDRPLTIVKDEPPETTTSSVIDLNLDSMLRIENILEEEDDVYYGGRALADEISRINDEIIGVQAELDGLSGGRRKSPTPEKGPSFCCAGGA